MFVSLQGYFWVVYVWVVRLLAKFVRANCLHFDTAQDLEFAIDFVAIVEPWIVSNRISTVLGLVLAWLCWACRLALILVRLRWLR